MFWSPVVGYSPLATSLLMSPSTSAESKLMLMSELPL